MRWALHLLFFVIGLLWGSVAYADYTWRNVPIGGGGYVTGVEFHPTEPGLLYARTDVGGAYRWDEQASSWVALNDDIGRQFQDDRGVLSLALDPADPDRVYLLAGLYHQDWAPTGALLVSRDRGNTWLRTALPFKVGGNEDGRGTGERLVVDPDHPERLMAGTALSGLWQSSDYGESWTRNNAFPHEEILLVHITPANAAGRKAIFVATRTAGQSLLVSHDLGMSWQPVPDQPENTMFRRADQVGPSLFLTGANAIGPNGISDGGVWRYDLEQEQWTEFALPEGQGGYSGLSVDPDNPDRIFVSTMNRWYPGNEIYLTEDGGQSWRALLNGALRDHGQAPYAHTSRPHWITDIAIDPSNTARIAFVTGYGVYQSQDVTTPNGIELQFMGQGMDETVILDLISPPVGAQLYSAVADIDGFAHYDLNHSPLQGRFRPERRTNNSLDFAHSRPTRMIRTIEHGDGVHIALSDDSGQTWALLAVDPFVGAHGGQAAISADGETIVWTPVDSQSWVTQDLGQTWREIAMPARLHPVADTVDAHVFYAFDMEEGVIFRSNDRGETFSAVQTGLPTLPSWQRADGNLVAVPGRAGSFYVSTGTTLLRARQFGRLVEPVPSVDRSYLIGFGAGLTEAQPSLFLWGVVQEETGFFRSDDQGQSWLRINDDDHQFAFPRVITGDSRVHGRIYIGTSGRGIIVGEPAD